MNNRKHCVWRVLWSKQKILKALFSKTKSCLVPFEKVGKSFSFLSFFFLFPKTKSCLVAFESVRIYLELPAFVSVSHWKHSYRPWNFRIINPLFYKQGIWCPVKGNDEPEVTELYAYHKYWTQRHGFNVGHFFPETKANHTTNIAIYMTLRKEPQNQTVLSTGLKSQQSHSSLHTSLTGCVTQMCAFGT